MTLTMRQVCCLAIVAGSLVGTANAFMVLPRTTTTTTTRATPEPIVRPITKRSMSDSTGWDSFRDLRKATNVPSGEEQRKFRRTVYSHDDWKKHRSPNRFLYYLLAIFKSGVYKNLGREVWATTLVAAFVCVYNGLVGGFQDFEGTKQAALISTDFLPKLALPLSAFTLTSPSLGLLLGTSW